MTILYRGVNADKYRHDDGRLLPKVMGKPFVSFVSCGDPHAVCGSGVECGASVLNEIIFHQWRQQGLPTSGISTSPRRERAVMYALGNGRFHEGYVFAIDVGRIREMGGRVFKVNDLVPNPAEPLDEEHIIVAAGLGEPASQAVICVEKVELADGHLDSAGAQAYLISPSPNDRRPFAGTANLRISGDS